MKKKFYLAMAFVASATTLLSSCSSADNTIYSSPENSASQQFSSSEAQLQEARSLYVTVDELAKMTPELKSRRKDNLILAEHINLDKDARTYSLNISKEEALTLGVSEKNYTQVEKELADANKWLQVSRSGDNALELIDLAKEVRDLKENYQSANSKVIASRSVDPQGVICTFDQTEGTDSFSTDSAHKSVLFICRPAAAILTACICKVTAFGKTNQDTVMASCFANRSLTLGLAGSGSGIWAELSFMTADSNGGSAAWFAQRK